MKIIGHRGARGLAPQNTIAGLRKGLEHHVDMLEFDVRITKDGMPILHHDASLADPNGRKLKISQHSYEELKQHYADLPTLTEALAFIDDKVPAYVEVKAGQPITPIIKVLKRSGAKPGLRLASKSQQTLRELHKALPEVPLIVIEPWSGVRAHRRARELGATEIAMNQLWLWWGFIRGFKHSKYKLYAYALNDPAKARRWAKWGLAGVITDYPDRFEN